MDFAETFLTQSRHYLGTEYRIKLHAAVGALPDGSLWSRANEESNSVGNLLLHLAGNVRRSAGERRGAPRTHAERAK